MVDRSGKLAKNHKEILLTTNYYIMKLNQQIKTLLPLAAFAGLALSANAATIITPTSATASGGGSGSPTNIVDSSGLSGGGISGDILSETHATASGGNWFGLNPFAGQTITFVVPTDSTVDQVHVWPFWLGTGFDWQIDSFDIEVSTNAGGTFTNIGSITLDDIQATGPSGAIAVQTRTFAEQTGVDQIRFSNIGNLGGAFAGISEVRFGSEPIPEPTTTALLGLGGLALILRRRKG